jgi:hypothetical protein
MRRSGRTSSIIWLGLPVRHPQGAADALAARNPCRPGFLRAPDMSKTIELRIGHDARFAQLTRRFLDHVEHRSPLPAQKSRTFSRNITSAPKASR